MLRSVIAATLVASALAAIKDPKSTNDCKANHDEVALDLSASVDDKCKALVEFSKCVSAFPADDLAESMLFEKNMKICENHWQEIGAPEVRTRRGNLEMTVDDAKQVTFYRHRRETINVFTMQETLNKLVAAVAATKDDLAQLKDTIETKVDADLSQLKSEAAENLKSSEASMKAIEERLSTSVSALEATVVKSLSGAQTDRENAIKSLSDKVSNDLSAATKARESALSALSKKVDTANAATKTELTKSLDVVKQGITDKPIHVWSGYPRSHNRGQSWQTLVVDHTEFDTAAPYFKKISNTNWEVMIPGLYKIETNMMTHTNSRCWAQYQVNVGGRWINSGTHTYAYSWKQTTHTIIYPIKKGQKIYSRIYAQPGCGNPYAWHSGEYTRFQITYVGKLAGKCTGNRCI